MDIGKLVDQLPFVSGPRGLGSYSGYWQARPSGDWAQDNALGALYASMTVAVIRRTGYEPLLGFVMLGMAQAGDDHRGLLVGFCGQIARHLMEERA